jgi:hypothetical protein
LRFTTGTLHRIPFRDVDFAWLSVRLPTAARSNQASRSRPRVCSLEPSGVQSPVVALLALRAMRSRNMAGVLVVVIGDNIVLVIGDNGLDLHNQVT